ncbi:MAG: hypothetical protein ACMXYC_05180 [Candidatus Woesearchaeota archaeon]
MAHIVVQKALNAFDEKVKHSVSCATLNDNALRVCPASLHNQVHMNEIVHAIEQKQEPTGTLKTFVQQCSQCQLCKQHSPDGSQLDVLLLALKAKIKNEYQQPLHAQPASMLTTMQQKYVLFQKKAILGELLHVIDKVPQASTILFAGEHIFCDDIQQVYATVKQHMKIMGGFSLHSGYDFYVQGYMQKAYEQFALLASHLKQVKTIVAPSLATYRALSIIKQEYQLSYTLLTLSQWLLQHPPTYKSLSVNVYHNTTWFMDHTCALQQCIDGKDIDEQKQLPTMEYNYGFDEHNQVIIEKIKEAVHREALVVDCIWTAQVLRSQIDIPVYSIGSFIQHE